MNRPFISIIVVFMISIIVIKVLNREEEYPIADVMSDVRSGGFSRYGSTRKKASL